MFKQKQWLAVVRGNHWIVAQVARRKFKLDILRLAEFQAPPDNEPPQEQYLGWESEKTDLLKEWLQKNHIPQAKLRLAVSCPGVITRMVTLPLLANRDLDQLLTEQVEQYFTLNIADYVVDYRLLDQVVEDGERRQRVLLAALPKYQWEKLWSEWEEIGLKPKVVDLAADGLARLYSQLTLNYVTKETEDDDLKPSGDLAIVELNAERVEFVLLEHGVFFLYADHEVPWAGLNQVREMTKGAELKAWSKTEIETTLGSVLQSLAEFFAFFAARHFGKSVDRIYLTGDYADLPFLPEIFQSNLEVITQVGFPKAWHPCFGRRIKTLQENDRKYGSLYGLAMREV